MDKKIICINGTPAAGKDTITEKLNSKNKNFQYLKKHRGIEGIEAYEDEKYFNIERKEFEKKINNDEFLQYHERYGRYYGVSKIEVEKHFLENSLPIIHIGKLENLKVIKNQFGERSISVLIWTKKNLTENRLRIRHDNNKEEINKRLEAYDEEIDAIKQDDMDKNFDIILENNGSIEEIVLNLEKYLLNGQKTNEYIEEKKKFNEYFRIVENRRID
ncbi:MAG: hypothetical protein ACRC30_09330 [Clostridium sp.]